MCHEYYGMWRRHRADEEARDLWRDFERTTPISGDAPPEEAPDVTRVEASEPVEAVHGER